ncbi:MAG: helix-turn-helix transcriptional regulator [Anaerolineaceae bacterium]|nr:helix-turn-helix transcriptional regulator [Anaerolineaceae bacterium]
MTTNDVQNVFVALADPARRKIIETLTEVGAKTATQLVPGLEMTRQGVTKHLNILADAGLVTIYQRGRDKYYVLTPEPLEEATLWISAIAARWDERLEALRQFLEDDNETTGET